MPKQARTLSIPRFISVPRTIPSSLLKAQNSLLVSQHSQNAVVRAGPRTTNTITGRVPENQHNQNIGVPAGRWNHGLYTGHFARVLGLTRR